VRSKQWCYSVSSLTASSGMLTDSLVHCRGLSGILHEKDCTGCEGKSNVDPVFGNHTNMQMAQRMVEAMMHEPGLLGYNTWGLYFSWTAYESYKWLKVS
jgi:hypothetical protein